MPNVARFIALLAVGLAIFSAAPAHHKRINQAIELLEQGQPVLFIGGHEGTSMTYDQGMKDAKTYADVIDVDMEHAPYEVAGLREYMRGLAAGGPTRSGHRIPTVIVDLPVQGTDEASVRANAWMLNQVLATGVLGVMLPHADTPGAIRAFVEAARFPMARQGISREGLAEGRRGVHGVATASEIWGVSQLEYEKLADPWPLNPDGELLLGLKEEDKYALANVSENLRVPGIAMSEWGEGDMALSLGVMEPFPAMLKNPLMIAAGQKFMAACKATHVLPMDVIMEDNYVDMIKSGVIISPASPKLAETIRQYTKRSQPY